MKPIIEKEKTKHDEINSQSHDRNLFRSIQKGESISEKIELQFDDEFNEQAIEPEETLSGSLYRSPNQSIPLTSFNLKQLQNVEKIKNFEFDGNVPNWLLQLPDFKDRQFLYEDNENSVVDGSMLKNVCENKRIDPVLDLCNKRTREVIESCKIRYDLKADSSFQSAKSSAKDQEVQITSLPTFDTNKVPNENAANTLSEEETFENSSVQSLNFEPLTDDEYKSLPLGSAF